MARKSLDLQTDKPHSARIYDYLLGGKDNYPADQQAAAKVEQAVPDARKVARANRDFMHRAARFAAESGIGQFLDIGTGIPTEPNLHQVVQEVNPAARVVYVDNDPLVLAHARALMTGTREGRTGYINADLTAPDTILSAPALTDTLDPDVPTALSLIAIGHFVAGDAIYDAVATLLDALAPGSYLAMTHLTAEIDPEGVAGTVATYTQSGIAMQPRSRDEFERFFTGLDLIEPGVVPLHRWRPRMDQPAAYDQTLPLYAAVGRKHAPA
ncbi:SAM-dependent methyltransferase [Nocardia carnea]|uniref:SAM-dependent methyltransferase n=1 Tax=Nocardia carnea TaxID=37328 RepID=UPI002458F095|nr:SAM-dependent methyltransferase [Nocardia carnea]